MRDYIKCSDCRKLFVPYLSGNIFYCKSCANKNNVAFIKKFIDADFISGANKEFKKIREAFKQRKLDE